MIEFKHLEIENFYSIKHVSLPINNGLFKVDGINYDVDQDDASNGAGKSSLLVAIQQCLFNKNLKNHKATIDDTYNKVTKKPYCIKVDFEKDGFAYSVTNDRGANKITITENGKDISPKGIKNQLSCIEDILGLDFSTFSALTYLSQRTVSSVFDLTNEDNVLYKFFDIEKLNMIEKGLKAHNKELKETSVVKIQQIKAIDRSLDLLLGFTKVDIAELRNKKADLQEALSSIEDSPEYTQASIISNTIEMTKEEQSKDYAESVGVKSQLKHLRKVADVLATGSCPTCGQEVLELSNENEEAIKQLEIEAEEWDVILNGYAEKITGLEQKRAEILKDVDARKHKLKDEINTLAGKILVVEQQQKEFDKINESADLLRKDKSEHVIELATVNKKLSFISAALAVIKSGAMTKDYINNFVEILNRKIAQYSSTANLPFIINTKERKGKLVYTFVNSDYNHIEYNDLSSGERTRASLIVLLATISTLETLTGISTNYIVFDELLSVLDANGLSVFRSLLKEYRNTKCTMIVLHHDEIEEQFFDEKIELIKKGGISCV